MTMDSTESFIAALVGFILVLLAYSFKPLRKAIGLLFVIVGGLACLTFIGAIIGIPMILVGGLLLFI